MILFYRIVYNFIIFNNEIIILGKFVSSYNLSTVF